ncbi:SMP-30/gluconolactonase/LRE family protein [Asticcacaulis sp. W401b]|uniref:SMP-30/gluconolactonase/LRE family protein n=1 Tax=Asticcacaulis sp. W401b TaxID=3388666 RepID=UPI003970C498
METIIGRTAPGAKVGEGPIWSARDGCLYWVDILGNALHAYYLQSGSTRTWSFRQHVCWIIEREKGGFILGLADGIYTLRLEPFAMTHLATLFPAESQNRLNDAKADNLGRIWAGSTHMPQTEKSGAFYRLNTDLTTVEVDGPYQIANGPTFSADHRKVYHTDSAESDVFVFDLIDGELANKRRFVHFQWDWGAPDGMTTDAQGGIWIAHWGGGRISRFTESGELDFDIPIPARQVTSLCFAGNDLDRLFVTTAALDQPSDRLAGTLFEVTGDALRGHTGLPTQNFKG